LLNLNYILVDLRIPFFSTQKRFSDPGEYAFHKINGYYNDLYLQIFQRFGFELLDVVPSSYQDPESGNTWAFMLKII